jgi:midasin (ATPase involved in ribosome maturation)
VPQGNGSLGFEPGIVLRCLEVGDWLLIDELNRADIDKAFGPLFTLLAGTGNAQETVLLPYKRDPRTAARQPRGVAMTGCSRPNGRANSVLSRATME